MHLLRATTETDYKIRPKVTAVFTRRLYIWDTHHVFPIAIERQPSPHAQLKSLATVIAQRPRLVGRAYESAGSKHLVANRGTFPPLSEKPRMSALEHVWLSLYSLSTSLHNPQTDRFKRRVLTSPLSTKCAYFAPSVWCALYICHTRPWHASFAQDAWTLKHATKWIVSSAQSAQ